MNRVAAMIASGIFALPLALSGQTDEICLTVPIDPNAYDYEQPRLVGVSLHLSIDDPRQEDVARLISLQCQPQNDAEPEQGGNNQGVISTLRNEIETLETENVALEVEKQTLQAENALLREELRHALYNVSSVDSITRRQCDSEKQQIYGEIAATHAEMAAFQAACAITEMELASCVSELAEFEVLNQLQVHCEPDFVVPPPSMCQSYIDAYQRCR